MFTVKRVEVALLGLIALVYFGVAALYAVKTPAWQVPDEPAHYNYAAQVATRGCCPVLQAGDWNNAYLDDIKGQKFSADSVKGQLGTIQYEDHQPPLYYLILAPVYSASGGNLITMRLVSALFGIGIIILAWASVHVVFPDRPWMALGTAAFVAFLPQHVAMMAGVENDSLAELIVGGALLVGALYLCGRRIHPVILGILLGLTFLTKLTIYGPVVAIVGLVILLRARREHWTVGTLVRQAAWVLVPAVLMGGIWWVRNIATYGDVADFMAQKTHDQVVVGQPRTDDYITTHGVGGWLTAGIQTTFDSFWGQFGWMGVPMTGTIYGLMLGFTILVIVGAGIALVRGWRLLSAPQREMLVVFGATFLMALAETAVYNLKFVQFQGRYLYPGLIPLGLLVAAGLSGWASLITRRFPLARWAPVTVMLFAVLDVYVLYRIILPALL